jgi:hypothetical protein
MEGRIAELEAATDAARPIDPTEAGTSADGGVAAGGDGSASGELAQVETDPAAELRDALRLGRLLLAGEELTL